jgi:K(+)-stimulated pyrophosphate-energized sodium pump
LTWKKYFSVEWGKRHSMDLIPVVVAISVIALAVAAYFARQILGEDKGTTQMQGVAAAIREGAEAFIRRQYSTIAILAVFIAVIILIAFTSTGDFTRAWHTASAFLLGAFLSALSGIIGMSIAVRSNLVSAASVEKSPGKALILALRGGAVSGLTIIALSLIGISIIFTLFGGDPRETPFLIVGFGFGASLIALFAQLGGGIYTKAADVGADLVGKFEAGIPEDDPRNPAVVADLVGDNVGDCAGRGADLFESTSAETIGAMILAVALYPVFGLAGILFPLVIGAFGLIATIVGIFSVRMKDTEHKDPMHALNKGYYITSLLSAAFLFIATIVLLKNIWFFYCGLIGIALSIVFLYVTLYYTDERFRPVKKIAKASTAGPAMNIIAGINVAFETTAIASISICAALLFAFRFGELSGVSNGGLYGTAIATMGMLMPCAYILAMDTFGPIVDNAGGIVEMSGAPETARWNVAKLDAAGNTTKALTKGYAVGSAALSAFLLFTAYMTEISTYTGTFFSDVNLAHIDVFAGALLGAMLVFLFAAYAIRGVGETAQYVIEEVRRQFKEMRILEGINKPDYARCVDITTRGALKNMILPGALAVVFPVVVGITLKYEAMAAFLIVGTITGLLMALVLNNGGGAWDNTKKCIEGGLYGGKGSEAHMAAIVGDTVGDPFKDTAGPSLHVLVKLLATLTLVLVPLYV